MSETRPVANGDQQKNMPQSESCRDLGCIDCSSPLATDSIVRLTYGYEIVDQITDLK